MNFETEMSKDFDPGLLSLAKEDEGRIKNVIEEREMALDELVSRFSDDYLSENANSVILEIFAGVGGEDAAMFASELLGMYKNLAHHFGWSFEVLCSSSTDHGGVRETICLMEGARVLHYMSHERGVHRVSRVPFNAEKIHTSVASVVVIPKIDEISEGLTRLNNRDIRIETMRASKPGGQNVDHRKTAVRVTHVPTGVSAHVSEERFAVLNQRRALEIVASKLNMMEREKRAEQASVEIRRQKGSGERHEKIRSYNFVKNRVVDHRIDLCVVYNLGSSKTLIDSKTLSGIIDQVRSRLSESRLLAFLNTIV